MLVTSSLHKITFLSWFCSYISSFICGGLDESLALSQAIGKGRESRVRKGERGEKETQEAGRMVERRLAWGWEPSSRNYVLSWDRVKTAGRTGGQVDLSTLQPNWLCILQVTWKPLCVTAEQCGEGSLGFSLWVWGPGNCTVRSLLSALWANRSKLGCPEQHPEAV